MLEAHLPSPPKGAAPKLLAIRRVRTHRKYRHHGTSTATVSTNSSFSTVTDLTLSAADGKQEWTYVSQEPVSQPSARSTASSNNCQSRRSFQPRRRKGLDKDGEEQWRVLITVSRQRPVTIESFDYRADGIQDISAASGIRHQWRSTSMAIRSQRIWRRGRGWWRESATHRR